MLNFGCCCRAWSRRAQNPGHCRSVRTTMWWTCVFALATDKTYVFNVEYFRARVDGRDSFVMGVNGMVPGPTIDAVVGDNVTVVVNNRLATEAVTLHWHGLEQRIKPWMDGVASVTQCAIAPNQSFVYHFPITEHPGTYWWHNHNHLNEVATRGMQGALIIHARRRSEEIHGHLYSEEHTLIYQDWFNYERDEMRELDAAVFAGLQVPSKVRGSSLGVENVIEWYGDYARNAGFEGPLAPFDASSIPFDSMIINGKGYHQKQVQEADGSWSFEPPPAEFRHVVPITPGAAMRLRLINAGASFAGQVCIDGHRMTVIATDAADTQELEVDCVNMHVAERYDVIIRADQPVANYWIRVQTLEYEYNHTALAVLNYAGVEPTLTPSSVWSKAWDKRVVANCFDWGNNHGDGFCLPLTDLLRHPRTCNDWGYCEAPTADLVNHHVAFRTTGPPQLGHFVRFGYHGPGNGADVDPFAGTFVQHAQPKRPPLIHGLSEDAKMHPHTLVMEFGDGEHAQLIFNHADRMSHPLHLHGHKFWVMGQGYADAEGCNLIYCLPTKFNVQNALHVAKLVDPSLAILKDTVVLPAGGWLVLRVVADNPGWWFFHCHINMHHADGFGFIVREGGDGKAEFSTGGWPAKDLPADYPVT